MERQSAFKSTSGGKRKRRRQEDSSNGRQDPRNPFVRNMRVLEVKLSKENTTYTGPTGMAKGKGKSGLKRLETYRKKQIQKRKQDALTNLKNEQLYKKLEFPRAAMARVIKSIMVEMGYGTYKLQFMAIDVIREVSENFLLRLFEDCALITENAKRTTLMPRDMHLYEKIRQP